MAELADYVDLMPAAARSQFASLAARGSVPAGRRQVPFLPVETLLCLAASFLVDHTRFGSSTAPKAPEPIQTLARLFRRPPSSVLAKMANLDGSRAHGARWDQVAGATLREHPQRFVEVYRIMLASARAAGLAADTLPDFLFLEHGGDLVLLGQEELESSALERELEAVLRRHHGESAADLRATERIHLGAVRVGQHVFANNVLRNCGRRCVFCGMSPPGSKNNRLLVASHIKPWRDSSNRERRDHRNGLAACPTHDVAFDTGLLTVNGGLRIHVAPSLTEAVLSGDVARHYFARPPLRDVLLLPEHSDAPGEQYLRWHKEQIFAA